MIAAALLGQINDYWFAPPLILAVSVVYAASRFEAWDRIWRQAFRYFCWITAGLVLVTAALLLINTQV